MFACGHLWSLIKVRTQEGQMTTWQTIFDKYVCHLIMLMLLFIPAQLMRPTIHQSASYAVGDFM